MLRRIFGLIMLIVALSGIAIAIFGIRISQNFVDEVGDGLDNTLGLVSDSLDTVSQTLIVTKDTVIAVSETFTSTQKTAADLATTVIETKPLIGQVGVVIGNDIPQSLEAIQATIPDLVQVAGTVDTTLTTLSNFRFAIPIPFRDDLEFDLGVEYAPAVPFDVSIQRIGSSLNSTPEKLRTINAFLDITSDNLETISEDLDVLAGDLENINENLDAVPPLVDDYLATVTTVNDSIRTSRATLRTQVAQIRSGLTWLFAWFGLTQLAPLYLGMELLLLKRRKRLEASEEA
jgi:methyl-accepting chemotaxis protein